MAFTFVKISPIPPISGEPVKWLVPAICKGDEAKEFTDVWEALDWAEYRCDEYNSSSPHRKFAIINSRGNTAASASVGLGSKARSRLGFSDAESISITVYNIRRVVPNNRNPVYFGTVIHQGETASVNYSGRTNLFLSAEFPANSEWTNAETLKLKQIYHMPKNRFKYPNEYKPLDENPIKSLNSIDELAEKIRRDWGALGLSMGSASEAAAKSIADIGKSLHFDMGELPKFEMPQMSGRIPRNYDPPVENHNPGIQRLVDRLVEVEDDNE